MQGQTNALDKVFEVFDNTKHCSEGRLIVIHVFLIPLIKAGLPIAVVTFFSKHIFWIQNKFKEKLETRNVLQVRIKILNITRTVDIQYSAQVIWQCNCYSYIYLQLLQRITHQYFCSK